LRRLRGGMPLRSDFRFLRSHTAKKKKKIPDASIRDFLFFRIVLCDLAYREIVRRLKASANDNGNADPKVQSIVFRVTISFMTSYGVVFGLRKTS
jgi:hypothetical protein